jgi:nucleoside-diphosphate-sugar epimerase
MRVLVTGGGGFIGAWVVRRLLAMGVSPRVMELGGDRTLLAQVLCREPAGIEWISGDISRRDDLEKAAAGCDRIIHLAGALGPLCHTNPPRAAEINYVGTLHLFTLAQELALPVVYASTALVHASDGKEPGGPSGHYGIFKLASELSADVFWKEHGLSTISIRPPVVYGFGRTMGNSAGLSLACRAAAFGQEYTIPLAGEVEAVYVEDVAAAFVMAALQPCVGAHTFNLIGDRVSVVDYIAAIRQAVPEARILCDGKQHSIAPLRPGRDIREQFCEIPKTSLLEGVLQTIEYYRSGGPSGGAGRAGTGSSSIQVQLG